MSFAEIDKIAAAEENAKKIIAEAEAEAKRILAEADAAGKASVVSAGKKARQELGELKKKTQAKTDAELAEMRSVNENKKAVLRVKAEGKLEKAAELVAERIVNG